jgi:hypothetical protein
MVRRRWEYPPVKRESIRKESKTKVQDVQDINLIHISYWKSFLISVILLVTFVTRSYAVNVTLAWDPPIYGTVAGYKIYYKSGSPGGPPYDGTGVYEGDSPITIPIEEFEDPSSPRYTLTGLRGNRIWFFVVTAYNIWDDQSAYSNEVHTSPFLPALWPLLLGDE